MDAKEWFRIKNVDKVDSPALIIYPERVTENIRLIKTMIDDVGRLRPHIKTHKTKEVSSMLLQAGITKFKCATIAEAELLGDCGAPDVLLAYQPAGPKLKRFIHLMKAFPNTLFSCLVDNMDSASHFSDAALHAGVTIRVFVDINAGMNRTGIEPGADAVHLYQTIAGQTGLHTLGFHVYDGHIRHQDMQKRKEETDVLFSNIEQMKAALLAQGFAVPIIIAGGTPTFPVHAARKDVECSPGTFVYWDAGYLRQYTEQPFQPAALVLTRVISTPGADKLCLDIGHKSVAAENELSNRVVFLNAPELTPISQSEEHFVVEAPPDHRYKIGDVLYALPVHICPTCALYEKAIVVENGLAKEEWKIAARDRMITI